MDARQVASGFLALAAVALAPGAASAFDCAKAASADEKAICASPEARAADEAMTKAFEALRASAPAAQKAMIVDAQVRWIGQRGQGCFDDKGDPFKGAKLSQCLAAASIERANFLSAKPDAGPGASSPMAPFFNIVKGRKGRADVDFELLKFTSAAGGGERAFNSAVDKLSGDISQPEAGDPSADHFAFSASMRLAYASPTLVSATVNGYQDTGGAHPNSYIQHINVDLAAGKALAFGDLADARAKKAILAKCLEGVRAEQQERGVGDDPQDSFVQDLAKNVEAVATDLSAWGFGPDKATIDFNPYAVGSYAEGYYDCTLTYAFLRPLVKAGFPLP